MTTRAGTLSSDLPAVSGSTDIADLTAVITAHRMVFWLGEPSIRVVCQGCGAVVFDAAQHRALTLDAYQRAVQTATDRHVAEQVAVSGWVSPNELMTWKRQRLCRQHRSGVDDVDLGHAATCVICAMNRITILEARLARTRAAVGPAPGRST